MLAMNIYEKKTLTTFDMLGMSVKNRTKCVKQLRLTAVKAAPA